MGLAPYYERDGIAIFVGDCLEVLPTLDAVDLVLTDPPYGIGAGGVERRANLQHGAAAAPSKDYGRVEWDGCPPSPALLADVIAKGRSAIVWGGNYFGLPPSGAWLVWDKDNGSNGYADCELAWTNLPQAVRRIRYRWMGMIQERMGAEKEERYHPTQKPLPVMLWALQQAPDAYSTLDPFMGSGTTLVAAKQLGRRAIGIELEEKWAEVAVKRLESTTPPLFTLPSEKPVQGQMEVPA